MEADHPAVVEEVAAATASNRMRTRKQLILKKARENFLCFLWLFVSAIKINHLLCRGFIRQYDKT